jgi:hypothetical protein
MAAYKNVENAEPEFAVPGHDDFTSRSQSIRRSRRTLLAIALVLVGAVTATAILLAAEFTRRPHNVSTASPSGSCTLSGTTRAPGGTLTVCAQYGVTGSGLVHVRSVQASYRSPRGYALPYFTVTLANAVTGLSDDRLSGPTEDGNAVRSYSSDFTAFRGPFRAPETMVVTLIVSTYGPSGPFKLPVASVAMVLSRHAFPCPNPAIDDNSIKTC